MPEYENSSFKEWKILEMTLNKNEMVDSKLQEQTMKERFGKRF